MGRLLITAGIFLLLLGLFYQYGPVIGVKFGELPGDIRIRGERSEFYFPLTTCFILSIATSAVLWVVRRLF